MDISDTILESLSNSDTFVQKSLPYLKEEYFEEEYQRIVFRIIKNFIDKYHSLPNKDTVLIDIENETGISDTIYDAVAELTNTWSEEKAPQDIEWLTDSSEEWCKDRAFYLAVKHAVAQLDTNGKKNRGDLPERMSDALAVSFDTSIGHDYFDAWPQRWKYYTDTTEKIPFDLDILNLMTEGGVEKKTLNVIMGGIHTGKTRFLCHLAAAYASMGLNVVYFTLEMAEEKIAQRIDANLLGIGMDDFKKMDKEVYKKAIQGCRKKTKGEVIIKEFPTGQAHAGHFRHVIKELKQKKDFGVDIVMVDYINICASSRAKGNIQGDSYTLVNMIAQELRGLGQEFKVPVWSATQVNRAAFGSSDPELSDVAESWGLPAVCDWLGALVSDEALEQLCQFILKQLKSRYSDKGKVPKGTINYSNTTMRLSNSPNTAGFSNPNKQGTANESQAQKAQRTRGEWEERSYEDWKI